jgi:cellulose synthase/poly-beta-1,6-N-acetylglucosamine synthase-like glycosyltransferase
VNWVSVFYGFYAFFALALFTDTAVRVGWYSYAWRTPKDAELTQWPALKPPRLSFSIMVPARHEETVLEDTLRQLLLQTHPDYEILVIVGHDDPGTAEVANRVASVYSPELIRVITDHHVQKNKPRAMNTALKHCTKQIIVPIDAEDDVAPDLLLHADTLFCERRVDIVQGGVQLMDLHSSWRSLRNCVEYYLWFASRLHYHAHENFVPLGGNTVFIRRDLLEEAGGWDGDCLAEDCEIGIRLSVRGAKVGVAYSAELATREETPNSLKRFIDQRVRWNQGYLQVLARKEYLLLPTWRQRFAARYLLLTPMLQAVNVLSIPIAIVTILLLKAPVALVLITYLPIAPALMMVLIEALGLQRFGKQFEVKVGAKEYAGLVLMAIPYQFFLIWAAALAMARHVRGVTDWKKTVHSNAHRPAAKAFEPAI